MKKYKDTDYLHVSVRLRAIAHKTAVDSESLMKIVDSRSVDTAVKILEEKGLSLSAAVSSGHEGVLTSSAVVATTFLSSVTFTFWLFIAACVVATAICAVTWKKEREVLQERIKML